MKYVFCEHFTFFQPRNFYLRSPLTIKVLDWYFVTGCSKNKNRLHLSKSNSILMQKNENFVIMIGFRKSNKCTKYFCILQT